MSVGIYRYCPQCRTHQNYVRTLGEPHDMTPVVCSDCRWMEGAAVDPADPSGEAAMRAHVHALADRLERRAA